MPITITDFTTGALDGTGAFDSMMESVKAHVVEEYSKSRIKGSEYAQVYLGSLQSTMQLALEFLLKKDLADLEAQRLAVEIEKLQLEKEKVSAEICVLSAQECLLRAQYDLTLEQRLKAISETALLGQKKVTEQAQTSGTGIDAASVIGQQIALYTAQKDGFIRDAEQKVAKIMVDSWNVRRTTDEATVADGVNLLADVNVGRAVTKLLAGVSA